MQNDNQENTEPEELVSQALYFLQLIQQDLNFGRRETCWARAKKVKELSGDLEELFYKELVGKLSKTANEIK